MTDGPQTAPEVCPICGETLPPESRACPECGADHEIGWGAQSDEGILDLPDDDFDYEAFIEREFHTGSRPPGIRLFWWITALILILTLIGVFLI